MLVTAGCCRLLRLLSVAVGYCLLLSVAASCCRFLSVAVGYCRLLSVAVGRRHNGHHWYLATEPFSAVPFR